jgi:hypothetical protein
MIVGSRIPVPCETSLKGRGHDKQIFHKIKLAFSGFALKVFKILGWLVVNIKMQSFHSFFDLTNFVNPSDNAFETLQWRIFDSEMLRKARRL